MTVRVFTAASLFVAIGAWAIWLLLINYLDPTQAGIIGLLLFFLTLFLAVASSFALIGFAIRRVMAPEQLSTYAVRAALRQGVLVGLFLDLLLILQLIKLYVWWLAIIAIILFLLIELIFLGYDKAARRSAKPDRPSRA